MTEWTPNVTPTTTYEQEAGMLPSGAGVDENILNLTTRAETAATNAETAETNAETAETNAETAQAAAEAARDAAVVAKTAAETAETNAETAQTAAEAAKTGAETAQTGAQAAQSAASTSATNAQNSATAAQTSATNAGTAQTAAESAQTAAETARDQTLTAFDNFDDRYLGSKASDPTLDNDGDALVGGALYFNTTDGVMKVYTGTQWVAAYADVSGALIATNNLSDLTNAASARTNLGLGTAATTASTDYATAAQGALADSALQSFTETNDLTAAVTWANVPDANITQSSVTQHQAALSITESQISDLQSYLTSFTETNDLSTAVTWANVPDANITQSSVTQHQAALSITESQISDLQSYLTSIPANSVGITEINVTDGTTGQVLTTNGAGTLSFADASTVAALNDLTDVDTTGITDGQTIVYNSGTSSFEPGESGGNATTLGLFEHAKSISTNYSITSGNNALAAGPVDIASGVTVTIPTGSRWAIV